MRIVSVPLTEILDLVSAASTYGYDRDVLMVSLYEFAGDVSDTEIFVYAASFVTPERLAEGYTEEDQQEISESLTKWRDKYRAKGQAE